MIKTICKSTALLLFTTFSLSTLYAQDEVLKSAEHPQYKANELVEEESIPVSLQKSLVADKTKPAINVQAVDSVLMNLTAEAEEMMFPADELYGENWSQEHVKAYGDSYVPDNYTIDVSEFVMPADGRVTSRFGWRKRRMHNGIDIKVQTGEPIRAAFDGKVRVKKYQRRGYGYYLVLRHSNGLETVYGHLSKFMVNQDEYVKAGQIIGLGGNTGRSTGSHLHFEFRFLGNSINPEHIVDFDNKCIKDDVYVFNKARSGAANPKTQYASKSKSTKNVSAGKSKSTTKSKATASSSTGTKYYKIKKGDTLGAIARRHGTTVNKLCKLNGISPTTTLQIGKSLKVS